MTQPSPSIGSGDRLDELFNQLALIFFQNQPVPVNTATIINPAAVSTTSEQILAANTKRKGLWIYNTSGTTSVFVSTFNPADTAQKFSFTIAAGALFIMPYPIYTGALYAICSLGTANLNCTEFT